MKRNRQNLKQKPTSQPTVSKRTEGYYAQIAPKAQSQARQDIASWKSARRQAENVDSPKRVLLHKLYRDVKLDAFLTSQINSRRMLSTSAPYKLYNGDKEDEVSTALVKTLPWFSELLGYVWDTQLDGTALIDFITDKAGVLKPVLIPKQNIIPERGILLLDETATSGVDYRNAKEYGNWLVEVGDPGDFGMLNKAVVHVLFKRFAQSCWSELCEIYGIPPRYIKTNTTDPAMLDRAEQMMRDMGSAAWFIIDTTEEFEFAQGVNTNGDVYNNLINLCKSEISLLFNNAIIGQDTKNGNYSKEKVSVEQLMKLAEADKRYEEGWMNTVVLPALFRIGLLPDGLRLAFDPQEDRQELYVRTVGFMQYLEPDMEWVNETFGVKFIKVKQGGTGANFQPDPKKK